jgi:hypothetical protein
LQRYFDAYAADLSDRTRVWSVDRVIWGYAVPDVPDQADASAMEECLDEMDEFIGTLQRFPDTVIAMSLRMHLAALLRAMVDSRLCSREDVREFVIALEREALGVSES